eukprot:COSAG01_NODE_9278_length_2496_cov_1.617438_1_plen_60_part_10
MTELGPPPPAPTEGVVVGGGRFTGAVEWLVLGVCQGGGVQQGSVPPHELVQIGVLRRPPV